MLIQTSISSNSKWMCVVSMSTLHGTTLLAPPIKREQFSYRPTLGGRFNKQDLGADTLFLFLVYISFSFAINIRRCWRPKSSDTYFISPLARAWRTRVDDTCPCSFESLEPISRESWYLSITEFIMYAPKPYSSHNLTSSDASPAALNPNR